jgi:hypothetical protein
MAKDVTGLAERSDLERAGVFPTVALVVILQVANEAEAERPESSFLIENGITEPAASRPV